MNTLERTTGNAFTRDPEYYEFLGAPKRVVRYDWTIRRYRWMVVCEPKSPLDRVASVNPNQQLEQSEQISMLDAEDQSLVARKRRMETKHNLVQRIIVAYLKKFGACSAATIMHHTGMKKEWIRLHLMEREGNPYLRMRVNGRTDLWGLVGIHDKEVS